MCRGCDGCCVLCLYCEAWSCRCLCMGSVSVSSCRCCMFVSCVHPVAVLNVVFCMTCSLLMLVMDARGDHIYFVGSHECLLVSTTSCCSECFMICRGLCVLRCCECVCCMQGSHRNLIMNFHDFSMTICHFSMTFDHQLNSFATTPFFFKQK